MGHARLEGGPTTGTTPEVSRNPSPQAPLSDRKWDTPPLEGRRLGRPYS
jgi:hypothetical protein